MYPGFPLQLIDPLRCSLDGGALTAHGVVTGTATHVQRGALRCAVCARSYAIEDGIVRMLDDALLDSESSNERFHRDRTAAEANEIWEARPWMQMETESTLAALQQFDGARVLEFGAGTGRFTVRMARRGASVLALDFSANALHRLARRVQPGWEIGLVQADCTAVAVAPRSFDIVLSTLVSNLPTAQHRARMFRAAATACRADGRFVFSTHHYGIRSVLSGKQRIGHYPGVPIFRYLFRRREIEAEAQVYFDDTHAHPMCIVLPFATRIGLPVVKLSRLTERVPLLNSFGELLLVVARGPRVDAAAQVSVPRDSGGQGRVRPAGWRKSARPLQRHDG